MHSSHGMTEPLIGQVSDTARWVAAYRARESERSDALFKDVLAAGFAGAQGKRIARRAWLVNGNGWPIVTRTKLIDDQVSAALSEGADCVLNLAAGFDTRPYRLSLPAACTWIEVDLPHVMDEKERVLATSVAQCQLRRERIDLADVAQRAALLDQVAREFKRVLVISEGLLPYLDDATVSQVSRDLLAHPELQSWVFDISSPAVIASMNRALGKALRNAPMRFAPESGVGFFEALGWRARDIHSIVPEAVRLKRAPWIIGVAGTASLLPKPDPRQLGRSHWAAVVRLDRGTGP